MPAVRQPQRQFRAVLFATILALRGRGTGRNLSRYCDYSERTLARQFRAAFAWPDFHQRVLTAALDPRAALISAQDASCIPKRGKPTFGLGHCFTGCAKRAERGLEIATLAVVAVTRRCAFTLAVRQPPPGADKAATAQDKAATRIDCYKQQLREQRQRLPERSTSHCVAGYFAKKNSMDEVVALKLPPRTKRRCDADCRFLSPGPPPQRRGRRRKYDGKGHFHDRQRVESRGPLAAAPHGPLSTALVWHGSLKRKLRVVVRVNRQNPAKPRSLILAATALELDGRQWVEL